MTTHRHHDSAALPADFYIRFAYVQLYAAHVHEDALWPAGAFTGGGIAVLLTRRHATPVSRKGQVIGYTLTARGQAFWERYARLKAMETTLREKPAPRKMPRLGRVTASRIMELLAVCADGKFHNPRHVFPHIQTSWLKEMRDRLSHAGYVTCEIIDRVMHVRITEEGRAALAEFQSHPTSKTKKG